MSQRRGEETKESRGGREGCWWDGEEGGISESGEKRSLADPKMHSSHPDMEGEEMNVKEGEGRREGEGGEKRRREGRRGEEGGGEGGEGEEEGRRGRGG